MFSKYSVKRPFTVAAAVVLAVILGFVSFIKMPTDLLPSMDLPYVMVSTVYPGATPEQVEESVTKPLEQSLATTTGIKNVSSVSSENASIVILEFNQSVNMDSVIIEINDKINMVTGYFDDTVRSPMIMRMNPDMMPIMMVSLDVEGMDIKEVTEYVNETIMPRFERIEGVASVTAMGLIEDQLRVTLDEEKISDVNDRIMAKIDSEFASGQGELDDAKKELNNAKSQLETQGKSEKAQLEQALKEVQSAKNDLQAAVDEIGFSKEELQENINEANKGIGQIDAQISLLEESLKLLPEGSPQYVTIQEQIKELEGAKAEIQEGIEGAKKGIEAIDALEELKSTEKELQNGLSMLNSELSKAENELNQGVTELENAQSQLDSAKEGAYESADITGIITSDMIGGILAAQNFSMPAGYIKGDDTQYSVKVGDKFETIEELENLLLFNIDGVGEIRLKDVSTVEFRDNSADVYTNINGNEGVILTFQKSSDVSTSEVTKSINKVIDELSVDDDKMTITTLMDQGIYIDFIIDSVLSNLIYGGILAVIVLLIFLKSIRPTIVIALCIPISVLFAMTLMYFSGITLNIISLSGLALGVGMLVDNSIVVLENIYRLRDQGMSSAKAAVHGAKQVSGAIFASTLTTICVFLPIVFTDGITRQLFVDMGLTIAYSLLASLIVALTVVPALSSNILSNVTQKDQRVFNRFIDLYEVVLRKSLDHKFIVIILAVALLAFSGFSAANMGTVFMPEMDSTQMNATITMPEDSKRSELLQTSDEFIDRVLTIDDVDTVGALEPDATFGTGGDMSFYIVLSEDKKLKNTEIEQIIYEKTDDLDCEISISTSDMDTSALGGAGIQVVVKGEDLEKLQEISKDIAEILESVEGTTDVSDGMDDATVETRVIVDKDKAMEYGLTVAQVYQKVSAVLEDGKQSTNVRIENSEYPVIVANDTEISQDNLLNYTFTATKGNEEVEIKLGDIATVEPSTGLPSINRDNQSRYITASAQIENDYNIGLVSRDVSSALSEYEVPTGYSIELKGEYETINEALIDLVLMISLAIAFVYLIMVSQFQSLLSPFIIMFTIPLAFTGGILALLITGNDLSIISMLGFLMLSGIIVNNGIVFVDYINQQRLSGKGKREAIIETGRARIRPILMTALTTILAMSTMAIGVGMGAEMSQGLAIVTIGGLIYGTILTLIVIPVIYDLFNRKELNPIIIDEDGL